MGAAQSGDAAVNAGANAPTQSNGPPVRIVMTKELASRLERRAATATAMVAETAKVVDGASASAAAPTATTATTTPTTAVAAGGSGGGGGGGDFQHAIDVARADERAAAELRFERQRLSELEARRLQQVGASTRGSVKHH
jgi:hypothetical protein